MANYANFAYSTVLTAPSPATSGTSLVVQSGQGSLFPAVPFNAVGWPAGVQPSSTNAEIVRVTARSTDTLTITRAQESTTAKSIAVGWQIMFGATARTFTDIESKISMKHAMTVLSSTFNQANNTSEQTITGLTTTITDPGYDYVVDAVANLNTSVWPVGGNTNINLKINGTTVNQIYQTGSVSAPTAGLSGQLAVSAGANAVVTVTVSNDASNALQILGTNNRSNVKMLVFPQ